MFYDCHPNDEWWLCIQCWFDTFIWKHTQRSKIKGQPKINFDSSSFGDQNGVILVILGVLEMALRVSESKFWDHFSIQTSPQNPQKDTLGTQIGPRKVIFGHFIDFEYFDSVSSVFTVKNGVFFYVKPND